VLNKNNNKELVMRVERGNTKLKNEEQDLIAQISQLTIAQKRHYYALEVELVKDPDTYTTLNWIFLAGLHHFYLGKWQRGILNLLLLLLGTALFFSQGFVLLGTSFIVLTILIELPQLFNSQKIIYTYNNQLMKALLKQVTN
jgi:hypothetical protein